MITWTDRAEPLLDAIAEALSVEGRPVDCALLAHGDPAVDCTNMLAVGIDVIPVAFSTCATVYDYSLQVVLIRPVASLDPMGNPWPAEVYTQNAKDLAADLTLLLSAIGAARLDGTIGTELCKSQVSAVNPIPPDGGSAGWSVTVRLIAV